MPTKTVHLPDGIDVDPEGLRLAVLGDEVIVGWAFCWSDGLVNFNILCGENGWYVELALHTYDGTMYASPCDWRHGDFEAETAEDLADMIAEVSCRTRPFPPWMDKYARDPFSGSVPGTWVSFDQFDGGDERTLRMATDLDLAALRKVAEEATPGPWWAQYTTACFTVIQGGDRTSDSRYLFMQGYDLDDDRDVRDYMGARADEKFIETFNPQTVLRLLDLLEEKYPLFVGEMVDGAWHVKRVGGDGEHGD